MIYAKGSFCTVPTANLEEMDAFEQVLFLWLCFFANDSGDCFPSVATLARKTGLSDSTVKRSISSLVDKGLVVKSAREGTSNNYSIIVGGVGHTERGVDQSDRGVGHTDRGGSVTQTHKLNPYELNPVTKPTEHSEFVDSQAHQPTPSEEAQRFFNSQNWQEQVITKMVESGYDHEFVSREVKGFVSYWTEPSKNGRRVRWQIEKTFEVRRRLVTWLNRATDKRRGFGAKPSQQWHVVN